MEKRGTKPVGKIKIEWSANFAYAIGLIVTDGCLYNDERHICFTSKDREQINNFTKCLGIKDIKTGVSFGKDKFGFAYRAQFGDIILYKFLNSIGIFSKKSKTIGAVDVPEEYLFDFLRGCFDGDGCFYSYWDPRWKSSHMFYIEFISASRKHIKWLQKKLEERIGVVGHISGNDKTSVLQLRYAKREALEIIGKMYYTRRVVCLSRKREKIEKALAIEKKQQKLYS